MGCSSSRASDPGYVEHVLHARWELDKELGRGAYSTVVLGKSKKIAGKTVAIKVMDKAKMKKDDEDSVRNEVNIMRKLKHRNIVMFHDFFDEGDKMYVVLEYLPGGDLFGTLQKLQVYSEKNARDLTFVLLSALKHMHDLNIVHRDLKPENLLMKSSEVADVTIADFGFAAYCPEPTLTETCGTPAYVAPEVLSSTPYGKSADMWSLGVITYILLGGYAPFDGKDMKELFRHIKSCKYDFHDEYWADISDNAKNFIKQLLVVDPKQRMTVDQALQHPWVKMAERDLVVKNLTKAIENFKSFNGKQKLKGAVRLVMASNTLKRFSLSQKASRDEEGSAFHDSAEIEIGWDKESEAEAGGAAASPETTTSTSSATAAEAVGSDYVQHSFSSRWIMGKKLGEGAFAEVKLCTSKKDPSRDCAVKIMNKAKMSPSDLESVQNEIDIMRKLKHPNIVQIHDYFDEGGHIYLIIEYLAGGELFDRIVKKEHYSEKEARDAVFVFLSALKHCHDRDIVHRDLKPENLLLASKDDDENVKIADFGLSAYSSEKGPGLLDVCGSPSYMAPEILNKQPYGRAVDLWALGVITYILLGGYPPFEQDDEKSVKEAHFVFHHEYWAHVSKEAQDFIKGLLVLDPLKRLTVDQALAHSWVKTATQDLAGRNLAKSLAKFKEFHAKRKLKSGMKAVVLANRLKKTVSGGSP